MSINKIINLNSNENIRFLQKKNKCANLSTITTNGTPMTSSQIQLTIFIASIIISCQFSFRTRFVIATIN